MTTPDRTLVIVHPGSACGSADFNLGSDPARDARMWLCTEIDAWQGGILVIDGSNSDELPSYPTLDGALSRALDRAKAAGLLSERVFGCDDVPPHQDEAVRTTVANGWIRPDQGVITVTGCWFDPSDESGCVNGVMDTLEELGFSVTAGEHAVTVQDHDDPDDDDDPDPE